MGYRSYLNGGADAKMRCVRDGTASCSLARNGGLLLQDEELAEVDLHLRQLLAPLLQHLLLTLHLALLLLPDVHELVVYHVVLLRLLQLRLLSLVA